MLLIALGCGLDQPVPVAVAHRLERLPAAVALSQGVVERRELPLADGEYVGVRLHGHPPQLLLLVVGGKGEGELPLLSGGEPDEGVDQPGDETLTIQLQVALLSSREHLLAAPHHQGAAQHVTGLSRTAHLGQLGEAPTDLLQSSVHVRVADLGVGPFDAQSAVVGEVDHGADGELGGELHGLAALDRPEGDRGITHRVEVLLVDGTRVELRDELLGRGVAQRLPADGTLDEPGGRLARPEPRDVEPGSQLPAGHPECPVQLFGRGLDGEFDDPARLALDKDGQFGACGGHVVSSGVTGPPF